MIGRKAKFILASFMVLALLLAVHPGCTKPDQNNPQPVDTVRLGYFANLTHAQALLAVHSGDFAKAIAPVNLKATTFNAGPSLIEAVISGDIDIGYVGPGPAITAWSKTHGQEIRVIAGAAADGVVIVAGPHSNIHTMKDLAGKKIASPQRDNTQDIAARHFVTGVLHEPDDKNVIAVANPEQVGRMSSGDIDAAWAPEPWGSRLVAQAGGTIIAEEKDLSTWPDHQFTLTLVIVRQSFLRDHPDLVRKILGVHHTWTVKLQTSPDAYVQQLEAALLAEKQSPLPPSVLAAALKHVKFTDDPGAATLQTMAQWSLEERVVTQPVKLEGLIDTSILNALP